MTSLLRQRSTWVTFLLGCAISIVVVVLLRGAVTSTEVRKAQVPNTQRAKDTQETLQLVKDCVTPGGVCYERGQRQTADAVGSINRVVILAAACSSGVPDTLPAERRQRLIEACVMKNLPTK